MMTEAPEPSGFSQDLFSPLQFCEVVQGGQQQQAAMPNNLIQATSVLSPITTLVCTSQQQQQQHQLLPQQQLLLQSPHKPLQGLPPPSLLPPSSLSLPHPPSTHHLSSSTTPLTPIHHQHQHHLHQIQLQQLHHHHHQQLQHHHQPLQPHQLHHHHHHLTPQQLYTSHQQHLQQQHHHHQQQLQLQQHQIQQQQQQQHIHQQQQQQQQQQIQLQQKQKQSSRKQQKNKQSKSNLKNKSNVKQSNKTTSHKQPQQQKRPQQLAVASKQQLQATQMSPSRCSKQLHSLQQQQLMQSSQQVLSTTQTSTYQRMLDVSLEQPQQQQSPNTASKQYMVTTSSEGRDGRHCVSTPLRDAGRRSTSLSNAASMLTDTLKRSENRVDQKDPPCDDNANNTLVTASQSLQTSSQSHYDKVSGAKSAAITQPASVAISSYHVIFSSPSSVSIAMSSQGSVSQPNSVPAQLTTYTAVQFNSKMVSGNSSHMLCQPNSVDATSNDAVCQPNSAAASVASQNGGGSQSNSLPISGILYNTVSLPNLALVPVTSNSDISQANSELVTNAISQPNPVPVSSCVTSTTNLHPQVAAKVFSLNTNLSQPQTVKSVPAQHELLATSVQVLVPQAQISSASAVSTLPNRVLPMPSTHKMIETFPSLPTRSTPPQSQPMLCSSLSVPSHLSSSSPVYSSTAKQIDSFSTMQSQSLSSASLTAQTLVASIPQSQSASRALISGSQTLVSSACGSSQSLSTFVPAQTIVTTTSVPSHTFSSFTSQSPLSTSLAVHSVVPSTCVSLYSFTAASSQSMSSTSLAGSQTGVSSTAVKSHTHSSQSLSPSLELPALPSGMLASPLTQVSVSSKSSCPTQSSITLLGPALTTTTFSDNVSYSTPIAQSNPIVIVNKVISSFHQPVTCFPKTFSSSSSQLPLIVSGNVPKSIVVVPNMQSTKVNVSKGSPTNKVATRSVCVGTDFEPHLSYKVMPESLMLPTGVSVSTNTSPPASPSPSHTDDHGKLWPTQTERIMFTSSTDKLDLPSGAKLVLTGAGVQQLGNVSAASLQNTYRAGEQLKVAEEEGNGLLSATSSPAVDVINSVPSGGLLSNATQVQLQQPKFALELQQVTLVQSQCKLMLPVNLSGCPDGAQSRTVIGRGSSITVKRESADKDEEEVTVIAITPSSTSPGPKVLPVTPALVKRTWRRPWKKKKEREKKKKTPARKTARRSKPRRRPAYHRVQVVRVDARNGPPIDTTKTVVSRQSEENIDALKQKRQRIKLNRNSGREYINRLGKLVQARKIGKPCHCPMKCWERMGSKVVIIFNNFWDLCDFNLQNSYLFTCLKLCDVKRRYTKKPAEESRRQNTFEYFVRISGKHVRVCKRAFMSAHGLTSDKRLRTLLSQMKEGALLPMYDRRGKHLRPLKLLGGQDPPQHSSSPTTTNKSKRSRVSCTGGGGGVPAPKRRSGPAQDSLGEKTGEYSPPSAMAPVHGVALCSAPAAPPPSQHEPPLAYIPNGELYFPAGHYLDPGQHPHLGQPCQKMMEAPAYFMAGMKENTFHQ